MPERCFAIMKPLGINISTQCPAPAFPGSVYCPLHKVMELRMKERARRHRRGEWLKR